MTNLQMKLTLLVFTLFIALAVSSAVSAVVMADDQATDPYVVETGETFYGPSAIQDAINDADTVNGYHIQIEPSQYFEQVTINKNVTLRGTGFGPDNTVIVSGGGTGTVIVPAGVSAVLENLAIWDMNNGQAIVNNGQLTLINCMVNGNYVANETTGFVPVAESTIVNPGVTVDTSAGTNDANAAPEPTGPTQKLMHLDKLHVNQGSLVKLIKTAVPVELPKIPATAKLILTPKNQVATANSANDPGIPLASLASGMLMVMGGTVVSNKRHH